MRPRRNFPTSRKLFFIRVRGLASAADNFVEIRRVEKFLLHLANCPVGDAVAKFACGAQSFRERQQKPVAVAHSERTGGSKDSVEFGVGKSNRLHGPSTQQSFRFFPAFSATRFGKRHCLVGSSGLSGFTGLPQSSQGRGVAD